eukprot:scaffold36_cov137-Skeletonema_dohrnii-CCMP3373.AAC.4
MDKIHEFFATNVRTIHSGQSKIVRELVLASSDLPPKHFIASNAAENFSEKKYRGMRVAYAKEESMKTWYGDNTTTTETNISPSTPAEPDLRKRRDLDLE